MKMKSLGDCYTLSNGVEIPCIGFGTLHIPDGKTAIDAVKCAIDTGYRHIDAAAIYGNEKSVGEAIRAAAFIPRNDLFVTSKLWNSEQGYDSTLAAFSRTTADLQLNYLDLYLIHWPVVKGHKQDWQKSILDTWKAFEKLYKEGRIRAIGVSNFLPHHLNVLMSAAEIMPTVNQIELHPGQNQRETVLFCQKNNILIEAWGPFASAKILKVPELKKLAEKYGKSTAQICIRWSLQNGFLPLPKSITPDRISENADVFDFDISPEDIDIINGMPYCGGSGINPDNIDF